jgi:hypothetical protein
VKMIALVPAMESFGHGTRILRSPT